VKVQQGFQGEAQAFCLEGAVNVAFKLAILQPKSRMSGGAVKEPTLLAPSTTT
jgi:hypothetical protein